MLESDWTEGVHYCHTTVQEVLGIIGTIKVLSRSGF